MQQETHGVCSVQVCTRGKSVHVLFSRYAQIEQSCLGSIPAPPQCCEVLSKLLRMLGAPDLTSRDE